MKPPMIDDNAITGTISLIITLLVVGGIGFGIYYLISNLGDFDFFKDLGSGTTTGILGFVSGAGSSLFNFGKDIGNKWNPFD